MQNEVTRLPSLNIQKMEGIQLKEIREQQKDETIKISYQITIMLQKQNSQMLEEIKQIFELSSKPYYAYCGYPIPVFCEILGWMNEHGVYLSHYFKLKDIDLLEKMDYKKESHLHYFQQIKNKTSDLMREKGLLGDCQHLVIARRYEEVLRGNSGDVYYNKAKKSELVVPLEWVFKSCPVDLIQYNIDEFPINNRVVVFTQPKEPNNKYKNGSLAIVVGHKEDRQGQKVQVSLVREPCEYNISKTDDALPYSLQYVSDKINSSLEVVLFVLGSVVVQLDREKESYWNLANSFDVGLNIINRQTNQLVPELARIPRCDQQAEGKEKYNQFYHLELSFKCVQLLCVYRKKAMNLFSYLEKKVDNLKVLKKLQAHEIYPHFADANVQLAVLYIWLMDQPSSKFLLCQSASSVISSSKIAQFEKFEKPCAIEHEEKLQVWVNPGFIAGDHSIYIPPFFLEHPPFHRLGDRVVLLNSNSQFPRLGSYGTVVGLIDTGRTLQAEILWDETYIGLSDLGGRCSLNRGSLCQFTDIFNLSQSWNSLLDERGQQVKGWQHSVDLYKPEFQQRSIGNADQHQIQMKSLNEEDPFKEIQEDSQYSRPKVVQKQKYQQQAQYQQSQQPQPQQLQPQQQQINLPELFAMQWDSQDQNKQYNKKVLQKQKVSEQEAPSLEALLEQSELTQLMTNEQIIGKSAEELEKEQQTQTQPKAVKVLTKKQ